MSKHIEAQIINAEEKLRAAMLASDVCALDGLLASNLVFTDHLGQCLDKEADLAAHKSGALTISRLEPSEQKIVILDGNVAIVSVRVQVAGKYAGQPAGGDFRFTRVWHQSLNNEWKVVAAHAGQVS